jgi:lipoic acid synthetase|tara:strand:+ start:164 stop:1096 length:933 start_codon:yes stop_codon:yes gene_type:complete
MEHKNNDNRRMGKTTRVELKSRPRLPEWFKVKAPGGQNYIHLQNLLKENNLHTVCQEARCPNIGDCWERKTATFMILGDICTRACRYCAVKTGRPTALDVMEPVNLAKSVDILDLNYCVITSVNRDDLEDGGASVFIECVNEIRKLRPNCKIELLIPDFSFESLEKIIQLKPDVLNHNIETVRDVFKQVRPKGNYNYSMELLAKVKEVDSTMITKSGLMVGLGEDLSQIKSTMQDLVDVGCDILTVGQYLRPGELYAPIKKFYNPQEFKEIKELGQSLGLGHVESGPLVRSSYHADEQHTKLSQPISIVR